MKLKRICILSCVLLLINGCRIPKNELASSESELVPSHTISEVKRIQRESIEKEAYDYSIEEFDVGSGIYLSPAGVEMPYHINGIMGMPEGSGPFPLVLITHGSHSNDNESLRFDTGYRYLVESLAMQGIAVVSMDMSKAYTWKYGDNDDREKSQYIAQEHLNSLIKANDGAESGYPFDLTGKLDLERIGLTGHSRGGETIFDIAVDMEERGMPTEALLSIAPTYMFEGRTWPEVKTAIVIPEYDGDVIGLDGFALYDVLGEKTKSEHMAVFLKKGNHNYFNANIQRNDAVMVASDRGDISDQLTRERQEAFLQAFASDFFYCTLQSSLPILSIDKGQPEEMYGEKTTLLYKNTKSRLIFSAGDESAFITENLTAEPKTDAWFFKDDELLADTITYGEEGQRFRKLLKTDWQQSPSMLQFKPLFTDWRGYEALTLDFVVDAADKKNWDVEFQRFTIQLTDTAGNTAGLKLPDKMQVLQRAPGKIDSTPLIDETIYFWTIKTPLSSLILPLSSFEGVDLSNIETVELLFEEIESGSLLIESLRVQ